MDTQAHGTAADIRRRFDLGRINLVRLLPKLAELRLYDNSAEGDPHAGGTPAPVLVLHVSNGAIVAPATFDATPGWAKPIVAAALRTNPIGKSTRIREATEG